MILRFIVLTVSHPSFRFVDDKSRPTSLTLTRRRRRTNAEQATDRLVTAHGEVVDAGAAASPAASTSLIAEILTGSTQDY
jgi:hypothetical protein